MLRETRFLRRSYCILSAGGASLSILKRSIELQGPDNIEDA
jgi:hypothetical protein